MYKLIKSYHIELPQDVADEFIQYLKRHHIKYIAEDRSDASLITLDEDALECGIETAESLVGMLNDGIKSCPFCGGISEAVYDFINDKGYVVACNECGTSTTYFKNREDAIDAWNNRV